MSEINMEANFFTESEETAFALFQENTQLTKIKSEISTPGMHSQSISENWVLSEKSTFSYYAPPPGGGHALGVPAGNGFIPLIILLGSFVLYKKIRAKIKGKILF